MANEGNKDANVLQPADDQTGNQPAGNSTAERSTETPVKTSSSDAGDRDKENDGAPGANYDPNDMGEGRKPYHWKSRYGSTGKKMNEESQSRSIAGFLSWACRFIYGDSAYARNYIRIEAFILGSYFIAASLLMVLVWLRDNSSNTITLYTFISIGGFLGGTMISTKWLCFTVAKGLWHQDKFLWRIFTPVLSSCLALVIGVIIQSGMFGNTDIIGDSLKKGFAIGFLVGFFSDNAIGRLTDIAESVLGKPKSFVQANAPSNGTPAQEKP